MKIPAQRYRCPLARLQPDVTDLEGIKRVAWHEQHILVVNADDARLDFIELEFIRQLGQRLYGVRHA